LVSNGTRSRLLVKYTLFSKIVSHLIEPKNKI
jgi:hypothetical protein